MQTDDSGPAAAFPNERGNVARLAVAQAMAGANAAVVFATGAVVGNTLAPDKALATLPVTVFVIGTAAATLPAGALAQRFGRRAVFMLGTGCGVLVGLLASLAVLLGSFWLFCLAAFFGGYMAVTATFRFAAADCAPADRRALSLVMAGGVFAGVIGPQLVTRTMDIWPPHLFAATYLARAAVAALAGLVLSGVRLPAPTRGGRPSRSSARRDPPPAPPGRRRHGGRRHLLHHELADDLRAARHAPLRAVPGRRQPRDPVARPCHVRPVLRHRADHLAHRRPEGRGRRFGHLRLRRRGRALRPDRPALLGVAGPARPRLELRLRRGLRDGPRLLSAGGADAGPEHERLRRVRLDGGRVVPVRGPAEQPRVGDGVPDLIRAAAAGRADAVDHGRAPVAARGPRAGHGGGGAPW